jgi:hypothetical protein
MGRCSYGRSVWATLRPLRPSRSTPSTLPRRPGRATRSSPSRPLSRLAQPQVAMPPCCTRGQATRDQVPTLSHLAKPQRSPGKLCPTRGGMATEVGVNAEPELAVLLLEFSDGSRSVFRRHRQSVRPALRPSPSQALSQPQRRSSWFCPTRAGQHQTQPRFRSTRLARQTRSPPRSRPGRRGRA